MPKAPLEQRSDDLQPKHAKAASPLEARKKKRSIIILAVLLAFLLCGVAAGCGYLIWQQAELDRVAEEMKNTPEPAAPMETFLPLRSATDLISGSVVTICTCSV